ncbi:hypothetical protein Vafri_1601 [Volvox africanus]|nr:hypothetical protein Vafri_1601 [Volvox africanus]
MADNDFIASDAFGDFFFFGSSTPSSEPDVSRSSTESPSRTNAAVFMFPVRSRVTSTNKHLIGTSSVDSVHSLRLDSAVDATATLVLCAPKQETDRACKEGPNSDDVAINTNRTLAKSEMQSGGEYGCGRSASLDTGNTLNNRDQCRPSDSLVAPHRSGSNGGSSGGGGTAGANHYHNHHHHYNHHNGWHSTEWWRSFSSSRLNEMTTEEPDKRSAEMRKVPYTGGAEPMYVLVHGNDQEKSD